MPISMIAGGHMKKSKRKVVSKMRRKPTKALKKSRTYNPQPGKPTGRAVGALERLEKLTQRYAATLQRILTELQQIRAVIAQPRPC
jgi:hypothetical protein